MFYFWAFPEPAVTVELEVEAVKQKLKDDTGYACRHRFWFGFILCMVTRLYNQSIEFLFHS